MSKNEKSEDKKPQESSGSKDQAKVEALSPEEVAELRRQLEEKTIALQKSEGDNAQLSAELEQGKAALDHAKGENAQLSEDLEQEKAVREALEAENRKLDKHAAQVEKSELKRLQNEEKVTINIAEGEGADGKDDVFVSVNAVAYQIKRGVDVKVPRSIYKNLRDAAYTVRDVYDDGSGKGVEYRERPVPRYNVKVVD